MIKYANAHRKLLNNNAALAGIAIVRIRKIRKELSGDSAVPKAKAAYIVRQFKRREEIELMRRTYGRKFVQISVFGSDKERRITLIDKIKRHNNAPKLHSTCEKQAIDLIQTDANEAENRYGQRVQDVFHLGDAFVPGMDGAAIRDTVRRFVYAFFGHNGISPTRDEYGLYIAAAASLRSIDLSRQVGAAIFSRHGEIIAMGSNEVPRAFGGTYWSDDSVAFRDYELGRDANEQRKNEILYDLVDRMSRSGLLAASVEKKANLEQRADSIKERKLVKESQLMDILEFGRMIHAEMSALTDAARLGRATKDGTLFCTTFPCHMCAKHIVASGVRRVVFLEPYPKSYAEEQHADSITFDVSESGEKVLMQPFIGISPRRYRDIFEKGRRKNSSGGIQDWYEKVPKPRVEDKSAGYIDNEKSAMAAALRRPSAPNRSAA